MRNGESPPQGRRIKIQGNMVDTYGDELASHLFQPKSTTLLSYLRLMVNGRDIAFLDGMNTLLKEGDEILILPPVSGG